MKKLTLILVAVLTCLCMQAQNVKVSGTVLSATDGEPLIGATVMVKGTTAGAATDVDGNFSIEAPVGKTLVFSYVGYTSEEMKVTAANSDVSIRLKENSEMLDDVVVVGYGTQKKSVVTAAISSIDEEKLANTAPVRVDNALKGLTSGVTVTSSSGQPGAAAQVRIRGIGTINNSDPLYIVDGMPIEGGLDYLNPTDIKSIEVLKDAASGAVYGARAANGVILVTTKNGQQGKTSVTYDFSYGWQTASKHRKVLNATEYAIMMNEGNLNSGVMAPYADPYSYGKGFDWQDAVFYDNAPVMNHQVTVSGASEKVNYFLSLGYYKQDGIVGGNFGRSNYNRLTLRSNTIYTLFDDSKKRNWLNKLQLTANLSYARIKNTGIETNSTWGSPLGSALAMSPILTPYAEGDYYTQQMDYYGGNTDYVMFANDGRMFLNPEAFGNFQEMSNPIANMSLPASWGWSHKFVGNFIGDLQIWDGIKYRISYGADLGFWGSDGYTPIYYLRSGASSTFSSTWSNSERGLTWQLENVLSWDKSLGNNDFQVILGQSAKASHGFYVGGSRNNIIDYNKPYIDASTGLSEDGDMSASGGPRVEAKLASYFARVSYNYDGRYMLQATVRRDGSSRFGSNNHWATFPSVSVGWNLTNEPYMEKRPTWLSLTKVRASWGKNGNENIGNLLFMAYANTGNNYIFGRYENVWNGTKASILPNENLRWEESQQTDVGIDLGFFNNALSFTVDYYYKKTDGMLMNMQVPAYVGESVPVGNVGKMSNQGVEMEISYRHNFGDFNFTVGGNLTWQKNKLIDYGNSEGWANLDSFQGVGTISRAQNGLPFPYFYGYKTDGIIQNQAEADAYNALYSGGYFQDAVPGDVRFVDTNGDGVITEDDRIMIGKGMPDWTYGFNLNLSWKGLTLSAFFQGVWGNKVYDATRRIDARATNLPSWMLNRWTGEGTSNTIPRFVIGDARNWASSDLYVHDGAYFRLKNIMLSYELPQKWTRKVFVDSFRVFVSGENLFTSTKYHGFDPEISPASGSGVTSLGVDYGVYPQPRVWTVGFHIGF